jgi:hypothetical protein
MERRRGFGRGYPGRRRPNSWVRQPSVKRIIDQADLYSSTTAPETPQFVLRFTAWREIIVAATTNATFTARS